jgi:hypothetical protein
LGLLDHLGHCLVKVYAVHRLQHHAGVGCRQSVTLGLSALSLLLCGEGFGVDAVLCKVLAGGAHHAVVALADHLGDVRCENAGLCDGGGVGRGPSPDEVRGSSRKYLLCNVKRVPKQGSPLPFRHMRAAVLLVHQPDCAEKRAPDERQRPNQRRKTSLTKTPN